VKFHQIIKSLLPVICCSSATGLWTGCASPRNSRASGRAEQPESLVLKNLLEQNSGAFDTILKNADTFRVQVLYTQIDRKKNNKPVFTHHHFNADRQLYFYPASTVKLPIALLALEKLEQLKKFGIDRNTAMITETNYSGQTAVYNDPTANDGKPSIAHYIKKIFLVSNNDAFNRLYEFLGQEYINKALRKKSYNSSRISHRLSIDLPEIENRHTNPVKLLNDTGSVLYQQNGQSSTLKFSAQKVFIGRGYMKDQKLIHEPFDFSTKNEISLADLHLVLQSVLFPGSVRKKQRFKISEDDRRFVLQYMSQYPSEALYPQYDSSVWDASGKLLLWGFQKAAIPKHIRIFNKVGGAYGFLTDVAYVVDFEKKIEFIVSATIYCNTDGIINDDRYDYEKYGFSFMKYVGQVLYDYEVSRDRKHLPDLTEFKMVYEK